MMLQSFRSKIFLLLTGVLLLIAIPIVVISWLDMQAAISSAEQHAVENVMRLAMRDIDAMWGTLFSEKTRDVREKRSELMTLGENTVAALQGYVDLASQEGKDIQEAQRMAVAWLPALFKDRLMFAYDEDFQVRASSDPALVGTDISTLVDIKGQPLAATMYAETRHFNDGFAVYHKANAASQRGQTWFASFFYFKPWDWVIVAADGVQDIFDRVFWQRAEMEVQLRESLGKLKLSTSGFLMVSSDDGYFVVPPPERYRVLLSEIFFVPAENRDGNAQTLNLMAEGETWHVRYQYFKPLGWTLAAVVPERDFTAPAKRLIERQGLVFTTVLLGVWLIAFLTVHQIVMPLSLLTRFVRRLPDEDLTAEAMIPPAVVDLAHHQKDEIGQLASAFLLMSDKLHDNVTRLLRETAERERIENELQIASDIQLGLLPQPLPEALRERLELAVLMLPAKEVGGDLCDYFPLPDGRSICLVIGDASGKGVPAAIFISITRTLVRAAVESARDPAAIVSWVNDRLTAHNPHLMFVTLLVGILSLDDGEFVWCNAGHPPLLSRLPDGSITVLQGRSGPACGVRSQWSYRAFSHRTLPGETLFGYTDGATEAVDGEGNQYGEARLTAAMAATPLDSKMQALIERLAADVQAFASGTEQFDDITLIAAKRT